MSLRPFHLAIPVDDLAAARQFYAGVMGCTEGRSDPAAWIDFDFFGHQLVVHRADGAGDAAHNAVDGHQVPVPHFGVVLTLAQFNALADRLAAAGAAIGSVVPIIGTAVGGMIGAQIIQLFYPMIHQLDNMPYVP